MLGCKEDDFYTAHPQHQQTTEEINIRTISLEEFNQKLNAMDNKPAIERYMSSSLSGMVQRGLNLTDYVIQTDEIKEIKRGDYTSYTMYLRTPDSEPRNLYNITVEEYRGEVYSFVTLYRATNNWVENPQQRFEGDMSTYRIATLTVYEDFPVLLDEIIGGTASGIDIGVPGFGGTSTSSYPYDCDGYVEMTIVIEDIPCGCGHILGSSPPCSGSSCGPPMYPSQKITNLYTCIPYGFPSDPEPPQNPNDPNPGGGGGNPGNGNGNPFATFESITGAVKPIKNTQNNCTKLNNLTQTDSLSANIKPIVAQLRGKVNMNKEWSCSFYKSMHYGEVKSSPQDEGIQEGISGTRSSIKLGTTWFGQIHTHPKNTYQIFSWLDLKALRDIHDNVHPDFFQDIFLMIVCQNGEVYSLRIDNFETLNSKINDDLTIAKGNNEKKKEDFLEEKMKKEYDKDDSNPERAFLKKFADYGVSVYKATDTNLTNWAKLNLDDPNSNNPNVISIPCN